MSWDITGIFQGDLIIKTAIELGLEDMRKNPWIIEDVFSSLLINPILNKIYGKEEIFKAKEFILNNKIPVYMHHRIDKLEYPCITVSIAPSREDDELATLGDTSIMTEDYTPSDIGKTIKYIIPPFNPISYDKATGIVEVPTDIKDYKYIDQGMVVIDPQTGNGFIISGKAGDNGFKIEINSELPNGKIGIIPQFQIYRARRERAISQEEYNIGCHVHGDVSTLIFLHSVVKYTLYRYRESLLEYNNFQLSRLASTDILKNNDFDVENVFSRWITIRGQAEESWVKAPRRFIEGIDISDPDSTSTFKQGIKIISKKAPEEYDQEDSLWTTIDGE